MGCAEDGLKEVIHKLLQCALGKGTDTLRSSPAEAALRRRLNSYLGDWAKSMLCFPAKHDPGDTVHQTFSPFTGPWQLYLSSVHRTQKTDDGEKPPSSASYRVWLHTSASTIVSLLKILMSMLGQS